VVHAWSEHVEKLLWVEVNQSGLLPPKEEEEEEEEDSSVSSVYRNHQLTTVSSQLDR
jgi:hypothetical protein